MNRKIIRKALLESEAVITVWRDHLLENCCLRDEDLKPIRETLDVAAKADVEKMEHALASIAIALKEVTP
jgi:hypothetical protein